MSTLREQLEAVRETYGRLTPAAVLDVARDESHPLHSRFEWDDTVAAEAWRHEQARDLIRSYRITYAQDKHGPKRVRGYVAVRTGDSPHRSDYVPTEQALRDPLMEQMVLRDLEREIAALKSKYGHLREFARLMREAVDDMAEVG